jgi:iron(III) transport system permease protein
VPHRKRTEWWNPRTCRRRTAITAYFVLALLPLVVLGGQWLVSALTGDGAALAQVFPGSRSLGLLWNSLTLATAVALLSMAIGTGLALWLSGQGRIERLVGAIYLIPLLMPPYVHALEWMAVAGRRQFLDCLFSSLPLPGSVSFSAYGFWPAVLVLTLGLFPIVTLLVRRGLEAIQPELLEAGWLVDTSWRIWYRIVIPLIWPSVIAGAGLVFVLSFVEYGVPSLLQHNVYIMEIYASFSQHFNPVRAFGAALPLMVAAALILVVSQAPLRNSPLRSQPGRRNVFPSGNWPAPARAFLVLCVSVWGLSVAVPVIVLVARIGSVSVLAQAMSTASDEFVRTLVVAAITGLVATMVAVPLAAALMQRMNRAWWLALSLPLAIPAPLTGVALIYIWNRPLLDWGYGTLLILVLAHLARFLPFAAFTASSGVRNIDPLLLEAAALPDVGEKRRLIGILLPIYAPTIITTWVVTFVLSLGELGASLLISPPGQATLPMMVYNLLHYGATDIVSALALLILLAAGVACAGVLLMHRRIAERLP